MASNQPIGIFDSGIGGLTVASAVTRLLPKENLIYFGDTAHLPYGDKSQAAIQAYSIKICDLLLSKSCKVILIACNSASAAAFDLVREYVGSKALVLDVINPMVSYVEASFANRSVGLIGTKQTIFSGVYKRKIENSAANVSLSSLATPLLVPMIEEGFFEHKISQSIIDAYLSDPALDQIEALILGCTHYPLIKHEIEQYYQNKVQVIDSSEIVAQEVLRTLNERQMLNGENSIATKHFFVSDYTHSFEQSTKIFFKEKISLEHYALWE